MSKALCITIFVILVVSSASACYKNKNKCVKKDTKCMLDPKIILDITNLGGQKVEKNFPCDKNTNKVTLDIEAFIPICINILCDEEHKRDCNGLQITNVTLLSNEHLLVVEFDTSTICLLDGQIMITLEAGFINATKHQTEGDSNPVNTLLSFIFNALSPYENTCEGPHCKNGGKGKGKGILGGLLG